MDDPIARKLEDLGLDRRGVVSPLQAAAAEAREAQGAAGPSRVPRGGRELVLQTRIAGADGPRVDARALAGLGPGARLAVEPAAGSPRDLVLLDAEARVVGRLPRESVPELAGLIAAGEELSARVTSIDGHRDWTDVRIDVFAREAAQARDAAGHGEGRRS